MGSKNAAYQWCQFAAQTQLICSLYGVIYRGVPTVQYIGVYGTTYNRRGDKISHLRIERNIR
nr:MAG TPA: hypothetical protein [Caudoviricetes sp.]